MFFEELDTSIPFCFQRWQWEYIIRMALKIDGATNTADNRVAKIYSAMNDKYGLDGNDPVS